MDKSLFPSTQYVGADCILPANDSVPNDDLRKTTIKMAKPPAVKLVIKNIADSIEAIKAALPININFLLLLNPVADAYRLARELPEPFQKH